MEQVIIAAIGAGTIVVGMVLAIPIYGIATFHRRKLEEIRARQKVAIAEETRAAIEALRQEMAALRDTTTQYDLSFDTALHRLDSRMEHVEQRVGRVERTVQDAPVQTVQVHRE